MERRTLIKAVAAVVILTIIAAVALFVIYSPKDTSYEGIPSLTPYVTDDNYVLMAPEGDLFPYLDDMCYELEKNNSCEVALLIVNETGKYDLNTYAIKVFEKNKLGQSGKDNGVLICFLVNDNSTRWRVVTGVGVEGILNGARLKALEQENLLPELDEGNVSWGIYFYTEAITNELRSKYISPGHDPLSDYPIWFIPLNTWQLMLVVGILIVLTVVTKGRILFFIPYLFGGGGGRGGWGGGGTGGGGSRGGR
ncbi:MAG: hypothetical protein A4E32_01458 [Methanomassiliicoccales archaeon PtaU1.Bin124]|nr:MAG: hypothetical protein A4E32_01458 [Methanomassiliicoccales archaeon PtaU1.Bin124]